MNNVVLKCVIDTGSSINIIRQNSLSFPLKEIPLKVHTINGIVQLNEAVVFDPSKICPRKQTFWIHNFSDRYDMLIGRD